MSLAPTYVHARSWFHALDPRARFVWLISVGLLSLVLRGVFPMLAVTAGLVGLAASIRILPRWSKTVAVGLLPAIPIVVVNLLWADPGVPISGHDPGSLAFWSLVLGRQEGVLWEVDLGPFAAQVSVASLEKALFIALRWANLVGSALLFIYSTRAEEFAASLASSGVPYPLAFTAGLAVRSLSLVASDFVAIVDSQRSRGLELQRGGPVGRLRALLPVFFPLVVCSIRRAMEASAAMESRAFGAVARRTFYRSRRMGLGDRIFVAGCVVLVATGVLLRLGIIS